jgi:hypothetical protein
MSRTVLLQCPASAVPLRSGMPVQVEVIAPSNRVRSMQPLGGLTKGLREFGATRDYTSYKATANWLDPRLVEIGTSMRLTATPPFCIVLSVTGATNAA